MLKQFFLFFIIVAPVCGLGQGVSTNTAHIEGVILNYTDDVHLIDLSSSGIFKSMDVASYPIDVDSGGNFSFSFQIEEPQYYIIGYNELYIEPQDSLHMVLDIKDGKNSTFSGRGAKKQQYLRNVPFFKSGSYLDGGRCVEKDHHQTIDTIFHRAYTQDQDLDKLKESVSPLFFSLEKLRIKTDILNSMEKLPTYYLYFFGKDMDAEMQRNEFLKIDSITKPYVEKYVDNLIDTDYFSLSNYRGLLYLIAQHNKNHPDISLVNEWQNAKGLNDSFIKAVADDDEVKVAELIHEIQDIGNLAYRQALERKVQTLAEIKIGQEALSFEFTNIKGDKINLEDLKGKPIYISFWATWCQPCIEERADIQKLANRFKGDVCFINLSIDAHVDRWKEFVSKIDQDITLEGWVDNRAIPVYNVLYVPRHILIDKDFNLVSLDATSPTGKELIGILKKMY